MNNQVSEWLNTAADTKYALEKAIEGFQKLSSSYEDIRNVGYKNSEKEAIDTQYSEVNALRQELCDLQAGGKRRSRKALRRRRTTRKR